MSGVVQTSFELPVAERYEALLRLSQTLISKRCSQELFSTLACELREVVNFGHLGVSIYDEKLHELRFKIFNHSGAPIPAPKLAPEESLTWWVYQHQQPLVIPAVSEELVFR